MFWERCRPIRGHPGVASGLMRVRFHAFRAGGGKGEPGGGGAVQRVWMVVPGFVFPVLEFAGLTGVPAWTVWGSEPIFGDSG